MRRRSTPFGMDLRSPFDSVLNFIPQGHEKALKHALYNAIAICLMFICVTGIVALFYILEPFIKPLLWAVLCGSVLYPFKQALANIITMWLQELNRCSTPLAFGLVLAPIQIMDAASEWVLCAALFRLKPILGLLFSVIIVLAVYNYTPGFIIWTAQSFVLGLFALVESIVNFLSTPVISAILIAHLVAVRLWWCKPTASAESLDPSEGEATSFRRQRSFLQVSATFVWVLTGGYLLGQGFLLSNEEYRSLRTPAFLLLFGLLVLGLLSEVWDLSARSGIEVKTGEATPVEFLKWAMFLKRSTHDSMSGLVMPRGDRIQGDIPEERDHTATEGGGQEAEEEEAPSGVDDEDGKATPRKVLELPFLVASSSEQEGQAKESEVTPTPVPRAEAATPSGVSSRTSPRGGGEEEAAAEEEEANFIKSYTIIYGVMWACVCTQIIKNPWVIQLLFLPLSLCLLQRTCQYFEVWAKICIQVRPITEGVRNWYKIHEEAIIPLPVKGLYKLMLALNGKVTTSLLKCVDAAASMAVMFGLLFFGLTAFVFLIVQSYGETFHMLQVFGTAINSTIVNNPELSAYIPEGMQTMVDTTLNNAYLYGREGLVSLIQGICGDLKTEARDRVESQVLELWDRVYQAWVMGGQMEANATGPKVTDDAVMHSWDNLLETVRKTPGLMNFNAWSQFAHENLETVISLTNSIWILLKGNISLFFTIVTTLLSVVLGGGSAVFGFFISTIVFLTALFYLLNCSGRQYKPVELISTMSPTYGPRIGSAFEVAINGVFEASFKMASFYGLWTWFIHNLFQLQIVYIPSALAALLAVVPFLGVYWASIPAIIDLWLAQGKGFQALLIFLAILLPCSMVDTAIYKEIKSGGHPYLTGLSIAGGIFCLGVEGAIMGPLLLCCLLVVLNLSTSFIKDSTLDTFVPVQLRRLRRMDSAL
ncbi:transmembrane protein 245 [Hetaerina americana]|uniref:transmembrane protein 245 n=1 Tax=Hetaerina americana TaxID=62018 RepID=UPI003A7F2BE6